MNRFHTKTDLLQERLNLLTQLRFAVEAIEKADEGMVIFENGLYAKHAVDDFIEWYEDADKDSAE